MLNEPTPIVFYLPLANAKVDDEGAVDTADLLDRIGATGINFLLADLHEAQWAGLTVHASAQRAEELVRLVLEFPVMDWIDMRLCRPDSSLINPEPTRRLLDAFGTAADALDCLVAFKSMTTLPAGWANWDLFLPDFDRVASRRTVRELIREPVDFGYTSNELEGVEWQTDRPEASEEGLVFDSTPGLLTDKGTIWLGERLPALV